MTEAKAPMKLVAFDAAKYLDDDAAIAEYMTAVLETNNSDLLPRMLSPLRFRNAFNSGTLIMSSPAFFFLPRFFFLPGAADWSPCPALLGCTNSSICTTISDP